MSLQVIVGPANCGKTGVVMEIVREALARGERPALLLPSRPDAEPLAREVARTQPLGVLVTTFDRYLRLSWERHGDGRGLQPPLQRDLVLSSISRTLGGSPGQAMLASTCIERLSGQVGPLWRSPGGHVPAAGSELAEVLRRYAAFLSESGLIEPGEAAHLLADRPEIAGSPLILHRFTDFTPAQRAFLGAVRSSRDVFITLTVVSGSAATAHSMALAEGLAPDEVRELTPASHHTQPELETIAISLGTEESLERSGAVRFCVSEGQEAQAISIAREVRLALSDGAASEPGEVAVVFRDPTVHGPAVTAALRRLGVPAQLDVHAPFASTSYGAAVLDALRFGLGGGRSALLALLRSPYAGLDADVERLLEATWRRDSVVDADELIAGLSGVCVGAAEIARTMRELASRPLETEGLGRLSGVLRALFGNASYDTDSLGSDEILADSAAYRTAADVVSSAGSLGEGGTHLSDVAAVLAAASVTTAAFEDAGSVQVTSVSRIRGRRFGTVVIGGLNAGEFPAPPAESMLPGSAVDDLLRAFGGRSEETAGSAYEWLLFYLAFTRARSRVVLSTQVADSEGEPLRASPLYEVVADRFRDADEEARLAPDRIRGLAQPPRDDNEADSRERLRARAIRGDDPEPRIRAAVARQGPRPARLLGPDALERLAAREVFSASDIESYLGCPYRWFWERALRPERLERAFDAADQGSLAHELLAATYELLMAEAIERVTPRTVEHALSRLDEVFRQAGSQGGPAASAAEELARNEALVWARRILQEDATRLPGFRVQGVEWAFGFDDPPVDLGAFKLVGFVDRIDVDEEGHAVVTDYKRSGGARAADVIALGKVQLPLYMAAVRDRLGVDPVAGIYRGLRAKSERGVALRGAFEGSAIVRTDVFDAPEFAAILEGALEMARSAVEGIRAGCVDADPRDERSCRYCSAGPWCGAAR